MPCFDPEVIYKNAFYAKSTKKLKATEIVEFTHILEKEIPKSKKTRT